MKRAGYEIIDDIISSLLNKDWRTISDISSECGLEWHEAKIYLEFLSNLGIVEKMKFGGRSKYKLSVLAGEHYTVSIINGNWVKSRACIVNRLITLNRREKAEHVLIATIKRLFQFLEIGLIKERDLLRNIGILFHSLNYHSKISPKIMEMLAVIELEDPRVYADERKMKELVNKILSYLTPEIVASAE